MRTLIWAVVLLAVSCIASAVQVNGFCYLEGQQTHGGTKVKFIEVSPSAVTDSALTLADGSFARALVPGIYNIQYSRADYQTQLRNNYLLIADSTLAPTTLIRPLSGALSGQVGPGYFSVTSNVFVNSSETLDILPGTIIEFDSAFSLTVRGTLRAIGNSADSIIFFGDTLIDSKKWQGIRMLNATGYSRFEYCTIRNVVRSDSGGAVFLDNTTPEFHHCKIENNRTRQYGNLNVGAAVYGQNSNPIFRECVISDNNAYSEAAIVFRNSDPAFYDCILSYNVPSAFSASIGGTATFVDCQITNNGSGISCNQVNLLAERDTVTDNVTGIGSYNGEVQILDCFLANNSWSGISIAPTNGLVSNCVVTQNGNGLSVYGNSGTTTISGCRISRNTSYSSGYSGGVNCGRSNAYFFDCQIDSNNARSAGGAYGGAVVCNDSAAPVFENCTFVRDSSSGVGGGVYSDFSSPTFQNCSFVDCFASGQGDALHFRYSAGTVNSCIVSGQGNEATYFFSSMNSQVQYCDFSGWQQPFMGDPWNLPPALGLKLVTNANGDSADIYLNIFEDPMFVDAGSGNFNIQLGSPCIDAGDPNLPLDVDGTIADMGAFYFLQDVTVAPLFLDFGVIPVLDADTLTVVVRNAVDQIVNVSSISLSNPSFQYAIASGDLNLAHGDSLVLEIYFRPLTSGLFSAQLMIVSDAQVNDTLVVGLSGEGGITPAPVADLTIVSLGGDATLYWSLVDTTTYGSPLIVDAYLVFFAESTNGPFWFHGLTTDTFYVHSHALQFASEMYYHVSAFVGEIQSINQIAEAFDGHISQDQLQAELRNELWRFPVEARSVLEKRPDLLAKVAKRK